MEKKYDIDESLQPWSSFVPPFNPTVFSLARKLSALWRDTREDDSLKVIKLNIPKEGGGSIKAILYAPRIVSQPCPAVVFLHGGGFCFPAAKQHYRLAKGIAEGLTCAVLLVDYSLGPDAIYPQPEDECVQAFNWLVSEAKTLNIDPGRIAVLGDSAGGYLALELCDRLLESEIKPCFSMLLYPVVSLAMDTPSMLKFDDTPMWNSELNAKMWHYHLGGRQIQSIGQRAKLEGFPETYIEVCEFDCLHDEGVQLAETLKNSSVPISLFEVARAMHGFDIRCKSPLVKEAMERRIRALKKAFGM